MSRPVSLYQLAFLAHSEMQRVAPGSAIAELDDEEKTEMVISGKPDALISARLDAIESTQAKHEAYLKTILKAVS